ncbi:hypothetical protein IL306_005698, partial [Fusarium sp. DS 682]
MTYIHGKPATLTKANLEYLVHHIFLPIKLPGGDDSSAKNEMLMVNFVLHTLNGGVLVHKKSASTIFETFELSPANKVVMTTQGRLVRQFPANATEIPYPDVEDEAFQSIFTKTLEKMSYQTVQETKHRVRKAKQEHDEDRETVEPRIVTDFLPSMLRGVGKQVTVPGICKNTHEEVMWSDSKFPWRRSPVWLLIRVGLQLTMARLARKDKDPYKEFMIFLMAQVLDVAVKQ